MNSRSGLILNETSGPGQFFSTNLTDLKPSTNYTSDLNSPTLLTTTSPPQNVSIQDLLYRILFWIVLGLLSSACVCLVCCYRKIVKLRRENLKIRRNYSDSFDSKDSVTKKYCAMPVAPSTETYLDLEGVGPPADGGVPSCISAVELMIQEHYQTPFEALEGTVDEDVTYQELPDNAGLWQQEEIYEAMNLEEEGVDITDPIYSNKELGQLPTQALDESKTEEQTPFQIEHLSAKPSDEVYLKEATVVKITKKKKQSKGVMTASGYEADDGPPKAGTDEALTIGTVGVQTQEHDGTTLNMPVTVKHQQVLHQSLPRKESRALTAHRFSDPKSVQQPPFSEVRPQMYQRRLELENQYTPEPRRAAGQVADLVAAGNVVQVSPPKQQYVKPVPAKRNLGQGCQGEADTIRKMLEAEANITAKSEIALIQAGAGSLTRRDTPNPGRISKKVKSTRFSSRKPNKGKPNDESYYWL